LGLNNVCDWLLLNHLFDLYHRGVLRGTRAKDNLAFRVVKKLLKAAGLGQRIGLATIGHSTDFEKHPCPSNAPYSHPFYPPCVRLIQGGGG
jgi:hypothetical protein